MREPTDELRAIRIALQTQDLQLCRLGSQQEWVALGLPLSPTLRYCQGRWVASHPELQTLITQAIGKQKS
jgi:hypothetical protein